MKLKAPHIFLAICFILVVVWFRGGNILGAGETGLPFYDLEHTEALASGAWNDSGVGVQTGLVVATSALYFVLAWLQKIGIPNFVVQGALFFVLLFFQLHFTYKLAKYLNKNLDEKLTILVSLFYLFNPISIVLVWHRFLINHMFFYSFLPFVVYTWLKAMENKDLSYVLNLAFVATLFSFGLFAPAQLLLFWLFMFLFTVILILKDGGVLVKLIFLVALVFFWTVSNSWWLLQFFAFLSSSSFDVAKATTFSSAGNLLTLEEISKQLGRLTHLLNFRHGNFFVDASDAPRFWSRFYYSPPVLALQWIFTGLVFYLMYKTRKNRTTMFFGALLLFFVFLTKGTNAPFGEIFRAAFTHFPILEAFRNPFEKFGLLLPVLTLLVILPVLNTFQFLRRKISYIFLFFFVVVVWGFPFWSGFIFTGGRPPTNNLNVGYQVEVPLYLEELDRYLEKNNMDGNRLISLPIDGEGIFYDWPKGYIGVEPSYFIISTPNISYSTSVPYFDSVSGNLERPFLESNDFYKIAGRLNARYLVVKKDVDELRSGMRFEEIVKNRADELTQQKDSHLSKITDFDSLDLYEFDNSVILPKIFLTQSLIKTSANFNISDILLTEGEPRDVLVSGKVEIPEVLTKQVLLKKEAGTLIDNPPFYREVINQLNFAASATSPTSPKYNLVLLKEKVVLFLTKDPEQKTYTYLTYFGKRLSEVRSSVAKNNLKGVEKSLGLYEKSIDDVFQSINSVNLSKKTENEQVWHEEELSLYFRSHLAFLKSLEKQLPSLYSQIDRISKEIKSRAVNQKILPLFDPIESGDFPLSYRQIFRFKVEEEGDYEIIIPENNLDEHFFGFGESFSFQLDDKVSNSRVVPMGNGISLGFYRLKEGYHEIGIEVGNRKNLVEAKDSIILSSDYQNTNHLVLPIKNFDPNVEYVVSFDYWIREGKGLTFNFNLDNDQIKDGKKESFQSNFLEPDNYKFDFRGFGKVFKPRPSSNYAEISLSVSPLNECENEDFFRIYRKFCANKELVKIFDKTTTVEIRNIRVERRRIADAILLSVPQNTPESESKSAFQKIRNEKYKVSVSVPKAPTLLVFSEAFHTGWKAYVGKEEIPDTKHILVNGYANGWVLDKEGDYEVLVEFAPVNFLSTGRAISLFSMGAYFLVLIWIKIWRIKRN